MEGTKNHMERTEKDRKEKVTTWQSEMKREKEKEKKKRVDRMKKRNV